MTRADKIRKEILLQVYATRPVPATAARMHRDARNEGYDYAEAEIAREIDFLEGEKLIERVTVPGVTALHWKISSAGVRHYEQNFAA